MVARILVVDDNPTNLKLMKAQLTAEYFEVVTATDGPSALRICQSELCDIVVLDVMMPGMDGMEVCRRLKQDPRTAHIPVIIVTRLDQQSDRVAGLEAGADDFLVQPASSIGLVSRLRSLVRLKSLTDALMARMPLGIEGDLLIGLSTLDESNGRILVVDDDQANVDFICRNLRGEHRVDVEADPHQTIFKVAEGNYDVVIVSLNLEQADGLRLCSQLRSLDRTHLMPILVLAESEDDERLIRALDLGVNDYLNTKPISGGELKARVRTQVKRKRFTDQIRDNVQTTLELALTDGLTGLRNRRFLERSLAAMIVEAYRT
ncbi:MAG: response regulator, partial [Alphaproteobacteria bacterium]